jgi:uncharacterized protein (UPF0276 family)
MDIMQIGTTWNGGDPAILERILPLVDVVEVTPDTIARVSNGVARIDGETLETLARIAGEATLVVHGIGLSIGSHDGWRDDYLRLIEPLFDAVPLAWHSEHLGYTHVDGRSLGTMLTMPRTRESLDLVCRRVDAIQRRYPLPFLMENVVSLIPEAPGEMSEASFLNELTRRTGCGLLLDVYNLECNAQNVALDVEAFVDELDFTPVREIHLANGVEERGLLLDVHSRRLRADTLALAERVLARATRAEVAVYELLPQALPYLGADAVERELVMLRGRLAA